MEAPRSPRGRLQRARRDSRRPRATGGSGSSRRSGARLERLDQRSVKLAPVRRSLRGAALVDAVEEVPDDLVRDEQSQQVQVPAPGQYPEQRRAVGVASLAFDRIERVFADRRVGDHQGTSSPKVDLARYGTQAPEQLPRGGGEEGPRPAAERVGAGRASIQRLEFSRIVVSCPVSFGCGRVTPED